MMWRVVSLVAGACLFAAPLSAQGLTPWGGGNNKPFWEHQPSRSSSYEKPARLGAPPARVRNPEVVKAALPPAPVEVADGGARPDIKPAAPEIIAFDPSYDGNTIVIDTHGRKLYYVTQSGFAYRYPIAVGKEGFTWTGSETISRKVPWPDWLPPEEMRERKPGLPLRMTGGVRNPLGVMALYLGNTLYRIHGTNDPSSIGTAASSGCFRMLNQHVVHLASLVSIGTRVEVLNKLTPMAGAARSDKAGRS